MPSTGCQCAINRTRESFLATELRIADTHWTRLIGLLGTAQEKFFAGRGLWIVPCHGVHTFAMRFPIDVIYLDAQKMVVHIEENVKPWRITPIRLEAASILELPSHIVWETRTEVGDSIEVVNAEQKGSVSDEGRSRIRV